MWNFSPPACPIHTFFYSGFKITGALTSLVSKSKVSRCHELSHARAKVSNKTISPSLHLPTSIFQFFNLSIFQSSNFHIHIHLSIFMFIFIFIFLVSIFQSLKFSNLTRKDESSTCYFVLNTYFYRTSRNQFESTSILKVHPF
ncbi:hypothetical protein EVA_12308 [gut metagenome]|uniref:Uncharacterized protein n=1 Tax=gut metagenome TaxID=749906 RepID=J9CHR6_9ZZZZ